MRVLFFLMVAGLIGFLVLYIASWWESFYKSRREQEIQEAKILSEVEKIQKLLFHKPKDEIRQSLDTIQSRIKELGGMDGDLFKYLLQTADLFKEQETFIYQLTDFSDEDLHDVKNYSQEYRDDFAAFTETLLLSNQLNHQDGLQLALTYHKVAEQEKNNLENIRNRGSQHLAEKFKQSLADLEAVRETQRTLNADMPELKR